MTAQTVPEGGNRTGIGGEEYELYALLEMDGNGEANDPDNDDPLQNQWPAIHWQYGGVALATPASDCVIYSSQ